MFYGVTCVIFIGNFFGELNGYSKTLETEFTNFNLPKGFDDDKKFDKSGFIPEMDFSHFFKRVDFDRSLNGFFDSPSIHPEASTREEKIGKKIHTRFSILK